MNFPNIHVSEAEKNKNNKAWYKQFIDAAISYYEGTKNLRYKYERLYDAYNGMRDKNYRAMSFLTNLYGVESRLKYVDYRLGRTKITKLKNEYLEMPFAGTVYAINEEAVKAKSEQQALTMGFMVAKPYIEETRTSGLNVFQGVNIPNPEDKAKVFEALNVKRKTEVVMQKMLDKKIEKDMLKEKFSRNLLDLEITAGEFGVVERDATGKDTYRPIELKNAIFVESAGDPLCKRTPIIGERRMMFKHEIFSLFPNMSAEERKDIENMASSPSDYLDRDSYYNVHGIICLPVYRVQWKAFKADITKISPSKNSDVPYMIEMSEEEYEKDSVKKDVEKGKYSVQQKFIETIYQGWRVGNKTYLDMEEAPFVIQTTEGGTKYIASYDYCACMVGQINGARISIYELADDLSEVYNVIRYQINRELSKIKGKVMGYNRAYLPKGMNKEKVMREMIEDSMVDFDTSQDGVTDPVEAKNVITEYDFGASQSLPVLIQLGQDVERVLDLVTGVTRTRQGMSRASSTATGIQTDVEGSLSMTYDLFYYHEMFTSDVCKKLCEKTKINWTYLKEDLPGMLYSDEEEAYLNIIRDMTFDNYDVYVSNSRKEQKIREYAKQFFPQEINAGKLRTKDAIEFEMTSTLTEGIAKLEGAWREIESLTQQSQQANNESAMQQLQAQQQMMDMQLQRSQKHDQNQLLLKGDIEMRNKLAIEEAKAGVANQDYMNDIMLSDAEFVRQLALQEQELAMQQNQKVSQEQNKINQ